MPESCRAHGPNTNTDRPSPDSQVSSTVSATEWWCLHGAGPETRAFVWALNYSCRVNGVGRRGRVSKTWGRQARGRLLWKWRSGLGLLFGSCQVRLECQKALLSSAWALGRWLMIGTDAPQVFKEGFLYGRTGKHSLHSPFQGEWNFESVWETW